MISKSSFKKINTYNNLFVITIYLWVKSCDVVASVLDCDIVVSEFKL